MSRELEAAARRFSDANSARLNEAAGSGHVLAQVASLSPLRLSWRGGNVPARSIASYTPAVGHTVLCAHTDDNQLIALGQII